MSEQPGHFVELKIEGEKLQRGFKCTMPSDAPCRRRPKDHELRESWTAEESTETGFACWAVEWVDAVGIEEAIYGGEFDGVLASVPVSIAYEECVSIEPVLRATSPDAALAAIGRVREALSLHNPNGRLVKEIFAALDGAPEPDDDPCKAETHSWSHYRPEQIDSYWIRCTRLGKHDEHEDSNTGLSWREPVGGNDAEG